MAQLHLVENDAESPSGVRIKQTITARPASSLELHLPHETAAWRSQPQLFVDRVGVRLHSVVCSRNSSRNQPREGVLRSYWFKEDIRRDFGIWSRLRSDP
jgi:hypothetical protein